MDVKDVEDLVHGLETVTKQEKKILVWALLIEKWITLKGYDEDLDLLELEQYYEIY